MHLSVYYRPLRHGLGTSMSIPDLVLASVEYLPYSGRACAGVVISGSAGFIAHHHEVAADDGQHQTKGESQHGISLAMMWKE